MHGLTGGSWKRNTGRARVTEMKDTRGNPVVTAAPRPTVDPRHRASSRPYAPVGFGGSAPRKSLIARLFGPEACLSCPVSPGRAGFPGAVGLSWSLGRGCGCQGKAARSRCQAAAMAVAQRQVASIRSRSWRDRRVIRAAVCRTR